MIGAGLLGLSAACSLARRGWSVDVLEAAEGIGHPLAGSKGDARIFRLGYPEPHYVAMASAAGTLWRELEEQSGRRLLHVTGQLSFGDTELVEALAGALADHEDAVEPLTRLEAEDRFPGVTLPGPALFEPGSGVLAAGECLRALRDAGQFELHARATSPGSKTKARAPPCTAPAAEPSVPTSSSTAPGRAHWRCSVTGRNRSARRRRRPRLRTSRQHRQAASTPRVCPSSSSGATPWCTASRSPDRARTPAPSRCRTTRRVPCCRDYDPSSTPAPALNADDPTLLRTLTDAVRRLLPALDPEPVATERCVYDNSADTDFVLDRVGNVVVGCGTSGHGFKFGPLFGELLADLADGTVPSFDLRPFRIDRTGQQPPPDQPGSPGH